MMAVCPDWKEIRHARRRRPVPPANAGPARTVTQAAVAQTAAAGAREGADVAIVYMPSEDDAYDVIRLIKAEGRTALAISVCRRKPTPNLDLGDD